MVEEHFLARPSTKLFVMRLYDFAMYQPPWWPPALPINIS